MPRIAQDGELTTLIFSTTDPHAPRTEIDISSQGRSVGMGLQWKF